MRSVDAKSEKDPRTGDAEAEGQEREAKVTITPPPNSLTIWP